MWIICAGRVGFMLGLWTGGVIEEVGFKVWERNRGRMGKIFMEGQ
jgi:hypothetical protein